MDALTTQVEIDEAPTALYRFFGQPAPLLYVGITDNLKTRLAQHAADKPWWPHVSRKTVEWYPTRVAAEAAEGEAIRAEHPLCNTRGAVVPPALPARATQPAASLQALVGTVQPTAPRDAISAKPITTTWGEIEAVLHAVLKAWNETGAIKLLCPVEELRFP